MFMLPHYWQKTQLAASISQFWGGHKPLWDS